MLAALPIIASANERVGDFSLLDQHGAYHQLSWYDDMKAVALFSQANDCAAVRDAAPGFAELGERFSGQNIPFLMLNAEGVDRDLVKAEMAEIGIELPVLMDSPS